MTLKNKENSQKHPKFANCTDFCEFSLFFQAKHAEFTKAPQVREPACESAFLWFGLLGQPLVAFMTVLTVPAVLESTLPSFGCLAKYRTKRQP